MTDLHDQRAAYARRLEEGLTRVVGQLRSMPGVHRISVFGSYARGRRDLTTDLDILVILETSEPVPERLARLYQQLDARVDLDLLAWTPAEYERMSERPFGRMIAAEEQVLYEAGSDH
ncbi:MAG: nucleotidyltransferase domain-containing protein [Gemmatimonas sp.]|nr:nucleotidyltransferase domain-containing protein [Gemmatimonas sp.]